MITIYRTGPDGVTWDVDGHRQRTCTAAYLASRKAYLVRTGGDDRGRVNVADHMLDESQIDELIAAVIGPLPFPDPRCVGRDQGGCVMTLTLAGRVAQDEEQAEARAEDLAWEHEQEMDRRVWDEVYP